MSRGGEKGESGGGRGERGEERVAIEGNKRGGRKVPPLFACSFISSLIPLI